MVTQRSDVLATIAGTSDRYALLGISAEPWMDEGLCAQTDPEEFFPEKGGPTRAAKAVCAVCPVAAECLDYALKRGERYGIWGGLSERERRKVSKALGLTHLDGRANNGGTHKNEHTNEQEQAS